MYNQKRCILIVDDEEKIVRGLKDFFNAKGFYIMTAYNGEEALNIYYENNIIIDIILLDVMMPILDGFEVLKTLRENSLDVPVIFLTAKDQEYDQLQGFDLGTDDYIAKPFSLALLLARIESVLNRAGKNSKNELVLGDIKLNINSKMLSVYDENISLTAKEYELLYYLIINKEIILSREKILTAVWGYDYDGDIRTVDTHIKQLRTKLCEKSSYIKTIHRMGYMFEVK